MQTRPGRTLQAELHESSGAKKRRHQDDNLFRNLMFIRHGFGTARPSLSRQKPLVIFLPRHH